MTNDNLNRLFKNLKNDFDVESPNLRHQLRFLDKLNSQNSASKLNVKPQKSFSRPLMGIAASIALLITISIGLQQNSNSNDLASVSPEMAITQDFFTTAINFELEKLNSEESPEFQELFIDALFQIKILEENYQQLKSDLTNSGNDKRVINAMIVNFQNRIELLQNVVQQIEDLKQQKTENNENSSTL